MYVQQPLTVAPPEIERRIEREEHDEEWAIEEEWTNGEKKREEKNWLLKRIKYTKEIPSYYNTHIRLKYP